MREELAAIPNPIPVGTPQPMPAVAPNLAAEVQQMRDELRYLRGRVSTNDHALNRTFDVAQSRNRLKMPEFSKTTDDFLSWRRSCTIVARINCYSREEALGALFVSLKGEVKSLVAPLELARPDDPRTLEQALDDVQDLILPAACSEKAMVLFDNLCQKPGESLELFLAKLGQYFRLAYQRDWRDPVLHRTFVRRFVVGMRNPWVRRQVFAAAPATIDDAMKLARTQEATLQMERNLHIGNSYGNRAKFSRDERMQINAVDKKKLQCFGCQQYGHVKAECPQERKQSAGRGSLNKMQGTDRKMSTSGKSSGRTSGRDGKGSRSASGKRAGRFSGGRSVNALDARTDEDPEDVEENSSETDLDEDIEDALEQDEDVSGDEDEQEN